MEYTQKSATVPGFADDLAEDSEGTGVLILYPGSSRVDVHAPPKDAYIQYQTPGNMRGCVTTFSKKSRKRLMKRLSEVTRRKRFLAVTLTYKSNETSHRIAQRHLHAFLAQLRRDHPSIAAVWKIEYQKRGAIHFHLLVWARWLDKDYIARTWDRVTDQVDDTRHSASTRVERPGHSRNATRYMFKYLSKPSDGGSETGNDLPDENGGRIWGVHNGYYLPVALPESVQISSADARGILETWSDRFGTPYTLHAITIFLTDEQARWLESLFKRRP